MNPLRAARYEKGLKQTELAALANCGQGTVADIENGKAQPSLDLARRLANALGKSLDDLFGAEVTR